MELFSIKIRCTFQLVSTVTTLSIALRKELPINKEYPTLILRIGYANPVPYSPRKNIETLLR